MQQLLKIDNIMYYVSDLVKATQFYTEILGLNKAWTDTNRSMVGLTFAQSDSEIVLQTSMPNLPFDYSFLVNNVHDFIAHITLNKGTILSAPTKVRCGYYAIIADLDGHNLPIIDLTAFNGTPRYD